MKLITTIASILLLITPLSLSSQNNDEEKLVRLIKAESAQTFEDTRMNIKRVTGNAHFLHNNALIVCDTAIWNVTKNTVDAIGNVSITQDNTTLRGDKIHYLADSSLAQVRGNIVELSDKDSNRLRTFFLDYNTKDSIAHFYNGGSMRDSSGNFMESEEGYYDSKAKTFRFINNVEMSAEQMLLKCDTMIYKTNPDIVEFYGSMEAWQNEGYIAAQQGWYDRRKELYFFEKEGYILNQQNEINAETILYDRINSQATLKQNVQIRDTAQAIILFGDHAFYQDSPLTAILHDNPAVAYYTNQDNEPDTLFFAGDTIRYKALPMFRIDSATVASSQKRETSSKRDPIKEMFSSKTISNPTTPPDTSHTPIDKPQNTLINPIASGDTSSLTPSQTTLDTLNTTLTSTDSTLIDTQETSLLHTTDSTLKEPLDTTSIRFISTNKNIRFFRSDLQGVADSMEFNSIDSIIRLYKDPVLWNEQNQFSGDSIQIIMRNNQLKKVDFLSNAFSAAKEDSIHYNQIKASDITAWFDKGDLSRFDAYGGVSTITFLAEDSLLTTMNKKECKVMTASIKNQTLQRTKYMETIKNDAYPVIDLSPEDKQLRGFKLRESERPVSRFDVCTRKVKESEREKRSQRTPPQFNYTKKMFGVTIYSGEDHASSSSPALLPQQ